MASGPAAPGIRRREFVLGGAAAFAALATEGCSAVRGGPKPAADDELVRLDALERAALVRRGAITPVELLEHAIGRAEALDPSLNAIVIPHFERARRQLARGEIADGPLRGVPFLLKDLGVALEGTWTSHGSRFFDTPRVPAAVSSELVRRYEAAGLVIFGKTASPEFGSSSSTESLLWGETQNPWRPDWSPGGSSGGSAAAVAAGIVPAAHASDGGGSIRIPASCCGLFGLKPSRGRVSSGAAIFDRAAGLAVDHAVTRTVKDSAALLDAVQGATPGDPYVPPPRKRAYLEEVERPPGRLRIGLQTRASLKTPTHPVCVEAAEDAARLCESLGHIVEPIDPPPLPADEMWFMYSVVRGTALALLVEARERAIGRKVTPSDLEPGNWQAHRAAKGFSALTHERERQRVYALARDVIAHHSAFDVVLSPTLAIPPPRLGVLDPSDPGEAFQAAAIGMAGYTLAYNLSGQPAMNVPLFMSEAGLPIGSMFVAGQGREDVLFRLAGQLEAERPWRNRWPTLAGIA